MLGHRSVKKVALILTKNVPKKETLRVLNFDMNGRLIIEPVGYTFYPGKATKRISKTIKGLYRGAVPSWGKVPVKLKKQMFLEFRVFNICSKILYIDCLWDIPLICSLIILISLQTKCSWKPEHHDLVAQNFEKKAAKILKDELLRARNNCVQPDWIQDEWWKDLLHYWATDPTF
ncbi:uncharacterized protein LOC132037443 isoform X1 [Lycium ferocissimum]|uniref:uncharacterized protein LOC132037443 isoform X1 n=1 Tax=Lycium ferocissimum TaxID=112874 RepID=UPI0028169D61|nr:uncharacterized protein LOC132037443 isoform X1 [Lycium ferocissimum]